MILICQHAKVPLGAVRTYFLPQLEKRMRICTVYARKPGVVAEPEWNRH